MAPGIICESFVPTDTLDWNEFKQRLKPISQQTAGQSIFSGNLVWTGAPFPTESDCALHLTPDEKEEINQTLDQFKCDNRTSDSWKFQQ